MNKNISYQYIAGFFDGEGCAIIVTVKRKNKGKIVYRFRPIISIAQKKRKILDIIQAKLKIGNVIGTENCCHKYQINNGKQIIEFIEKIVPYSLNKNKQLLNLKEFILFQKSPYRNRPYSKKEFRFLINLRDKNFSLNRLNNPKLKQKYPQKQVLEEHYIPNLKQWQKEKNKKTTLALNKYNASIKLPRIEIKCACGCGKSLTNRDNKARLRKYIIGHNTKGTHWRWKKNVS